MCEIGTEKHQCKEGYYVTFAIMYPSPFSNSKAAGVSPKSVDSPLLSVALHSELDCKGIICMVKI